MKKLAYILIFLFYAISFEFAGAQVSVGSGQTYTSLRAAFNAINNGELQGDVVLRITSDLTETSSAKLYYSGRGSSDYSSVTIYPASEGIVVTGNFSSPLIDLDGADNVYIDGRVNGNGTGYALTIRNISTSSTTGTSTIRFINSASQNMVRYCVLEGRNASSAGGGIIYFSTSSSGSGNDDNIIDSNKITGYSSGRPVNAVLFNGTSGRENSGNSLINNDIYDFFRANSASQAINISNNSTEITVTGNSFYETTSFTATSSVEYAIIRINNPSGSAFNVSGNYIGGSQPLCAGTPWTKSNNRNNIFTAIHVNAGSDLMSSVQGNIIANFDWNNSGSASWTGINIAGGSVNIGTVTGNIIGNETGTGSIQVSGKSNGVAVTGINISSNSNTEVRNNIIGSFLISNANSRYSSGFTGIYKDAVSGNLIIAGNTIGSRTVSNSIELTSSSTSYAQSLLGIYSKGTGTVEICDNYTGGFVNNGTSTSASSLTRGIYADDGTNNIAGNMVYMISTASSQSSTLYQAALIGIAVNSNGAGQHVDGNIVSHLYSTCPSDRTET